MNRIKQLVKDRENNQCFFCENENNLTYAHIWIWKKDNGKISKENGVCLCRECHDKMDFKKGISREEQLSLLRKCKQYLLFMYCIDNDFNMLHNEIPMKYLKK